MPPDQGSWSGGGCHDRAGRDWEAWGGTVQGTARTRGDAPEGEEVKSVVWNLGCVWRESDQVGRNVWLQQSGFWGGESGGCQALGGVQSGGQNSRKGRILRVCLAQNIGVCLGWALWCPWGWSMGGVRDVGFNSPPPS